MRFLCLELLLMCSTRDINGHLSSGLYLAPKVSPNIRKSHTRDDNSKLHRSHTVLSCKFCKLLRPGRLFSLPCSSPTLWRALSPLRLLLHPLLSPCSDPDHEITIIHDNSSKTSKTKIPITKPSISTKSNRLSCTHPTATDSTTCAHGFSPACFIF